MPRETRECFNCHKTGHIARDCYQNPQNKHKNPRNNKKQATTRQQETSYHKAKVAEADGSPEKAFSAIQGNPKKCENRWYLDCGASSHMVRSKDLLLGYHHFKVPEPVALGDGHTVDALGYGECRLKVRKGPGKSGFITLHRVLYVPSLVCNLFSFRMYTADGYVVQVGHTRCWFKDAKGNLHGTGRLVGIMYQLDVLSSGSSEPESANVASSKEVDWDLWHQRFGHLNGAQLGSMISKGTVRDAEPPKGACTLSFCEGCVEGKMHQLPCPATNQIRSKHRLELIHTDVCGPFTPHSLGGSRYFVTFVDDYSRCCAVYSIRQKSQVLQKFKEFEALVCNETGERIVSVRSDWGGEYMSGEFQQYLKSQGIRHETSTPGKPQQNGVAERMNRTIEEMARTLFNESGLPRFLWAEAVTTAAYIRNRCVSRSFKADQTPYERWYGEKPSVGHLRVFGSAAYAHIPSSFRGKLDKKSVRMRLVGYSGSKGYRLYDPAKKQIFVRKDVVFNEGVFSEDDSVESQNDVKPTAVQVEFSDGTEPPAAGQETQPATAFQEPVGGDRHPQPHIHVQDTPSVGHHG